MKDNYIHLLLPSTLSKLIMDPSHDSLQLHVCLNNYQTQLYYLDLLGCGAIHWSKGNPTKGHDYKEPFFLPQRPLSANSSSLRGGPS